MGVLLFLPFDKLRANGVMGKTKWVSFCFLKLLLIYGLRVMSVYRVLGVRMWVITEVNRSSTTILLPEEY